MTPRTLLADGEANYATPRFPDLAVWYTAGSVPAVIDGATLAAWAEYRGNGPDLAQATGGNQPSYRKAVRNAWPIVRFDGSDFMATASFAATLPQPLTIAVALKLTVATGSPRIICGNAGPDLNVWLSSNKWALHAGSTITSAADADTSWHVMVAVLDGASSLMELDGTQIISGNAGAAGLTSLRVGSDNLGSNGTDGDIAEVLLYARSLSAAEKLQVQRYLGGKYSITVP